MLTNIWLEEIRRIIFLPVLSVGILAHKPGCQGLKLVFATYMLGELGQIPYPPFGSEDSNSTAYSMEFV